MNVSQQQAGQEQPVAQLGELDGRGRIEARALAQHVIGAPERTSLFKGDSEALTAPVRLKGILAERPLSLATCIWP